MIAQCHFDVVKDRRRRINEISSATVQNIEIDEAAAVIKITTMPQNSNTFPFNRGEEEVGVEFPEVVIMLQAVVAFPKMGVGDYCDFQCQLSSVDL
jgi:hypothetical protein